MTLLIRSGVTVFILTKGCCTNSERKHNQNFWNLINKKGKDYENEEKDLLTYWFLIQKAIDNPQKNNKTFLSVLKQRYNTG